MRLSVLGPPELVRSDGSPAGLAPGKTLAVLVYLAHATSPPSRAELARLFWPNSEPSKARHSVRQTLSLIRKVIGEEAFASDDPVRLRPGAIATDTEKLLDELREGGIEAADRLWRGTFAEGLVLGDAPEWNRWVEERQLALEHRLCEGLTSEAEAARFRTDAGAESTTADAIRLLRRALTIDPYRERPRVVLTDLLVKQGKLDEAADEIAEARRALGEDTDELQRLERLIEAEVRRRYAAGDAGPAVALADLFVGRTDEMSRLIGAWARAEEGVPVTAIVEGPAGMGKTRLCRELVAYAGAREAIVAFASPLPAEAGIPGGVLQDLEAQLIAGSAGRDASRPDGRGIAERPDAVRTSRPHTTPPGSARNVDEVEAAERLSLLLRRAPYPVLLVVDDLQWADPVTRSVLARVLRRIDGAGCLFLLTVRSEAADRQVRLTVEELLELPGTTGIELGPLSDDEVRELLALAARIEELEGDGALTRFLEVAGGRPLYVIELLRTLAESGILSPGESGQLRLSGPLPDPLPFPRGLRELLERRIRALPEEAVEVAAQLAGASGRAGFEALRRSTDLAPAAFRRGLGTLLDRDILRWAGPAEVAFTHEEVRRAVARAWPLAAELEARSARRRGRWLGWAAMALAIVPISVVAGWRLLGGGAAAPGPPPPFGGGKIVLASSDWIAAVRPLRIDPDSAGDSDSIGFEVERDQVVPTGTDEVQGPFRTTDGSLHWYGRVTDGRAPPWVVRFTPDGSTEVFARSDWEEGRPALSPDGGFAAWTRSRLSSGVYIHELRLGRADGSDARTVRRSDTKQSVLGWAPSGRFLLLGSANPDASLFVVTPAGDTLAAYAFDSDRQAAWCGTGDRFVVNAVRDGRRRLLVASVAEPALVATGAEDVLRGPVACSPDGSAALYPRAIEGRRTWVVGELATGAFHRLPVPEGLPTNAAPVWLPDSLPPVVIGPALDRDSIAIDWGDTLRLASRVRLSDGADGPGPVEWTSSDPAVASVQPSGLVSANAPGTAWIRAVAGRWRADSIRVRVLTVDRPDVLLLDEFSELDAARWVSFGAPPARAWSRADTTALALRGDGSYHDGVISTDGVSLRGGATLELEYRLPVSRDHWQMLSACLIEAGPDVESWRGANGFLSSFAGRLGDAACAAYPADELGRFHPSEIGLTVSGEGQVIRLPDELPADGWVHLAIQVRGDGMTRFFLNRRPIGTGLLRLTGLEAPNWHVLLLGKSVDTELLVRRVVLWRGARFGG